MLVGNPENVVCNCPVSSKGASLVAQTVKNLPTMQETWEDTVEKWMATHSSILAWRIPWREEPGMLQSMRSQRIGHGWVASTVTSSKAHEKETERDSPYPPHSGSSGTHTARATNGCTSRDQGLPLAERSISASTGLSSSHLSFLPCTIIRFLSQRRQLGSL